MGEKAREALVRELRELRWLLTGLNMAGLKDWPIRPPSDELKTAEIEPEPLSLPYDLQQALLQVREELGDCRRCRLHADRTRLVFGEGSAEAGLVFVGEGPGFEEDQQGRPFVGKAGKLLDKMILALHLSREAVYICNVVKCRPPGNRTPNPDEIKACAPFLLQQLDRLRPRVICALGGCAAQTLLGVNSPISRLRGKVHSWRGIPLLCTFHPAYLLRNPSQKALVWQDLLIAFRLLQKDCEGSECQSLSL